MATTRGYISGSKFVPSEGGKYTQDSSGKVTDTSTGQTSGASYETKSEPSTTKSSSGGSSTSTIPTAVTNVIGPSLLSTVIPTKPVSTPIPVGPVDTSYKGPSFISLATGTDKMSINTPSVIPIKSSSGNTVGYTNLETKQSIYSPDITQKQIDIINQNITAQKTSNIIPVSPQIKIPTTEELLKNSTIPKQTSLSESYVPEYAKQTIMLPSTQQKAELEYNPLIDKTYLGTPQGMISEYHKPTFLEEMKRTNWDVSGWLSGKTQKLEEYSQEQSRQEGYGAAAKTQAAAFGAIGLGAASGFTGVFLHPVDTAKGLYTTVTNPVGSLQELGTQLREKPATTIGTMAGQAAAFDVVGGFIPPELKPKISFETPGSISPVTELRLGGFKYEKGSIPSEFGPIEYKIAGLEFGSRAKPLISKVSTETAIRGGETIRIQRTPTGQFKAVGKNVPTSEYLFGEKAITARINPSELGTSIPQPASALGARVVENVVKLTPEEMIRLQNIDIASRNLGYNLIKYEKGLPIKDAVINIKDLKNPTKVSNVIEDFAIKNEGVYYGSATEKYLPEGFRTKQPGDIDIFLAKGSAEVTIPEIAKLAEKLRKMGEDVRVSPQSPTVIEFTKTGEKLIEFKLGQSPELFGEEIAPTGYRGFQFSNLKGGESPFTTVKFGTKGARAITAGEQFLRKGAGTTIYSPGLAGETASFSEAGILGKQVNPRGLKDVADFFRTGQGIVEIKQAKLSPLQKLRALRGEKALKKAYETYTPEQRADITAKIQSRIGQPLSEITPIEFSTRAKVKYGVSEVLPEKLSEIVGREKYVSPNIKVTERSPFVSPEIKSPYTSPITKSPFTSPSVKSPYTSPTSPYTSPITKSPSPTSPSPEIKSPYTSPITKSPSPVSKSPYTSPITKSPSPYIKTTKEPNELLIIQKRKKDDEQYLKKLIKKDYAERSVVGRIQNIEQFAGFRRPQQQFVRQVQPNYQVRQNFRPQPQIQPQRNNYAKNVINRGFGKVVSGKQFKNKMKGFM